MGAASMPATRTATASARCTSTPWKGSGRCCAPGCVHIGASRKTSCHSTSASSSSCTMLGDAAKLCLAPSSPAWSRDVPATTPEPDKSLIWRRLERAMELLGRPDPTSWSCSETHCPEQPATAASSPGCRAQGQLARRAAQPPPWRPPGRGIRLPPSPAARGTTGCATGTRAWPPPPVPGRCR